MRHYLVAVSALGRLVAAASGSSSPLAAPSPAAAEVVEVRPGQAEVSPDHALVRERAPSSASAASLVWVAGQQFSRKGHDTFVCKEASRIPDARISHPHTARL